MPQTSPLLIQRDQVEMDEVIARNVREGKAQAEHEAAEIVLEICDRYGKGSPLTKFMIGYFESGVALGQRMMGHRETGRIGA